MEKAYILISCEIGTEHDLVSQLKTIDSVKNAIVTYGEYDVVIEAEAENEEKMNDLIMSKLRKLEKIRTTITLRVTV